MHGSVGVLRIRALTVAMTWLFNRGVGIDDQITHGTNRQHKVVIQVAPVGMRCWHRGKEHQNTSVFAGLNKTRVALFHVANYHKMLNKGVNTFSKRLKKSKCITVLTSKARVVSRCSGQAFAQFVSRPETFYWTSNLHHNA